MSAGDSEERAQFSLRVSLPSKMKATFKPVFKLLNSAAIKSNYSNTHMLSTTTCFSARIHPCAVELLPKTENSLGQFSSTLFYVCIFFLPQCQFAES